MHVQLTDATTSADIGPAIDSDIIGECIQKDAKGNQAYSINGSAISIFLSNYVKPARFPARFQVGNDPLIALLRPFNSVAAKTGGSLTFLAVDNGSFKFDFDVAKVTLQYKTVHAEGTFKFFTCPPTK